jgi:hypothetical protein
MRKFFAALFLILTALVGASAQAGTLHRGKPVRLQVGSRHVTVDSFGAEELQQVLDYLLEQTDIPFLYLADCCHDRAEILAKRLEDSGVIVGKVFAQGDLFVPPVSDLNRFRWNMHVALLTARDGVAMVLDPSLSHHPLTVDEWRASLITENPEQDVRISIADRFVYIPTELDSGLSDWMLEDLETARLSLIGCSYLQERIISHGKSLPSG